MEEVIKTVPPSGQHIYQFLLEAGQPQSILEIVAGTGAYYTNVSVLCRLLVLKGLAECTGKRPLTYRAIAVQGA